MEDKKVKIEGVYDVFDYAEAKPKRKEQPHKHPSATKNARGEPKPRYVGSLGDVNDEGCVTHNNERFVITDKHVSEMHRDRSKLQEYVVFSEILGKPKCKK